MVRLSACASLLMMLAAVAALSLFQAQRLAVISTCLAAHTRTHCRGHGLSSAGGDWLRRHIIMNIRSLTSPSRPQAVRSLPASAAPASAAPGACRYARSRRRAGSRGRLLQTTLAPQRHLCACALRRGGHPPRHLGGRAVCPCLQRPLGHVGEGALRQSLGAALAAARHLNFRRPLDSSETTRAPRRPRSRACRRCRSESRTGGSRRGSRASEPRHRASQDPASRAAPGRAKPRSRLPNRTWSANHRLKLRMTPTTAAVTPASAPASRGFALRRST